LHWKGGGKKRGGRKKCSSSLQKKQLPFGQGGRRGEERPPPLRPQKNTILHFSSGRNGDLNLPPGPRGEGGKGKKTSWHRIKKNKAQKDHEGGGKKGGCAPRKKKPGECSPFFDRALPSAWEKGEKGTAFPERKQLLRIMVRPGGRQLGKGEKKKEGGSTPGQQPAVNNAHGGFSNGR